MGQRGPTPKANSVTRHKPKQQKRSLDAKDVIVPELPVACVHPDTLEWWQAWVDSPQAAAFAATDWQALRRCAVLVELFNAKPTAQLAAEIRQIEAKIGATVADRDRLGMKFDPPRDGAEDASPGGGSSRRRPDPRRSAS